MLDTTCPSKRILHYARANFKNNFDITNINTTTAPILDYVAPGSKGEAGDNRQYSFLMYVNPQRKQIDALKLPADGEAFDAKKFKDDNGFQDPAGGVGMVVKLGGTADCGSDTPNGVPENLPTPVPARSSNAGSRPTSVAGGSSKAASSAAGSSPTPSAAPGNGTSSGGGSGSGSAPAPSAGGSSGLVVASSAAGGATPTVVLSVAPGNGGASNTASAGPAQQTANTASNVAFKELGLLAPLFAVAGLIAW